MDIKKEYTLKYIKRNFLYVIGFAIIIFLGMIGEVLIQNHHISMYNFKLVLLFTGIFSIFAIIPFFISFFYIIRFYKTISMQEKEYNTIFSNNNEIVLSKWNLTYLSDEWFIEAGSLAIYYKNIKSLNIRSNHRIPTQYFIIFKTNDGKKYKIITPNSYHYTKIRKWWNNLKEKEIKKVSDNEVI